MTVLPTVSLGVCANKKFFQSMAKAFRFFIFRINEELTQFHNEVLANLSCVHGALLRMSRSIQSEGTLGGIKWNRQYDRLRRRGIEGVILELGLISCGINLHKYHLKRPEAQ